MSDIKRAFFDVPGDFDAKGVFEAIARKGMTIVGFTEAPNGDPRVMIEGDFLPQECLAVLGRMAPLVRVWLRNELVDGKIITNIVDFQIISSE